nr:DUF3617 domain-containing protein [uncultured Sphingomonas sp.]
MKIVICALSLLALAACNKEPSVKIDNASAEEVAKQLKESGVAETLMTPGQWEYTMTIMDLSAPGMPTNAVEQMKRMMGHNRVVDKCVTEADVKKVDAAMGEIPKHCTYDHYEIGGGKIDGAMTCSNAGVTQKTRMSGSYTSESSDVTATSETSGASGPMGNMTVTMNMKGKRIGACV